MRTIEDIKTRFEKDVRRGFVHVETEASHFLTAYNKVDTQNSQVLLDKLEDDPVLALIIDISQFDHFYSFSDDGAVYRNASARHAKLDERIDESVADVPLSAVLHQSITKPEVMEKYLAEHHPEYYIATYAEKFKKPGKSTYLNWRKDKTTDMANLLFEGYITQMKEVMQSYHDFVVTLDYPILNNGWYGVASSRYNYASYHKLAKEGKAANEGEFPTDWTHGIILPVEKQTLLDQFLDKHLDQIKSLNESVFKHVNVFSGSSPISFYERAGLKLLALLPGVEPYFRILM